VAPQLAEADQAVIDEARAAREKLRQAEQAASKASRAAVDDLRSQGMTVRDVARLVGVTPSRVSQLS
jgi:DNA-directed RNA polymerase specialized sigma subunit